MEGLFIESLWFDWTCARAMNRVEVGAACPGLSGRADLHRLQRRNRTIVPALHGPGSSQRDDPHQQRRFMERGAWS
jgi:hypothetical protein